MKVVWEYGRMLIVLEIGRKIQKGSGFYMEWLSASVGNSWFCPNFALDLGNFCVISPVLYLVDITGGYKIEQFDVSKANCEAFVRFPAAS